MDVNLEKTKNGHPAFWGLKYSEMDVNAPQVFFSVLFLLCLKYSEMDVNYEEMDKGEGDKKGLKYSEMDVNLDPFLDMFCHISCLKYSEMDVNASSLPSSSICLSV